MRILFLLALLAATTAIAELSVTVSPVEAVGQKAVVPLAMRNNFSEKIESARAVCFILDDQGKMVGQSSRWVIGGQAEPALNRDAAALAPGATNTFNFVVTATKPLTTTNLTAKVTFSRVVLEGGGLADHARQVVIAPKVK
jgi:hypothetical protein